MSSYGMNVLIEGCARGADHAAESFGRDKASHDENFVLREFPAEWDKYGKAAGPIRNHQMLDALLSYKDTHLLTIIAFHDNISASRGTKNMITIAEAAGITATVVRHPQDVQSASN